MYNTDAGEKFRNTWHELDADKKKRFVQALDKERVELKKIAMEGQAARSMYMERQQQLNDLTEAHMHQSHFIQKLQKKISKMDNYKSTINLVDPKSNEGVDI